MIIKKLLIAAMLCILPLAIVPAQDSANAEAAKDLIKKATFSIETDDVILNFVFVNNTTAEGLFTGPSKYQIRAIASQTTVFYVHGITKRDVKYKPEFEVLQNAANINTKLINIQNFKDGEIAEGTKIEGLIQLVRKINLFQPFTIKDNKKSYEFEYTYETADLLES